MNELIKLLKMTEQELKTFCYNYLMERKMNPIFEDGFVYAKGDIPILLVAHLDTVFDELPVNIQKDENTKKIFSMSGGLGGDDRCGVYAIMKILEEYKPHILFTEGEENGGHGALETVKKLSKPNLKYIIEFDRHGSNDCIFYECGNNKFIKYIESFGFTTELGIFSDISILGPKWDIAAVNISSGYYREHTHREYIMFNELVNNIERVKNMLKEHHKAKYYDYQEIKYQIDNSLVNYEQLFSDEYNLLWEIFKYPVNTSSKGTKKLIRK